MLRRTLALAVVALATALLLAAGAFAAAVKIRVEGRTQTIFGVTQPTVQAGNALQALDAASVAGEFYFGLTTSSFGTYVSQIGRYAAAGNAGWVFKVNGVSPPVGADQVMLKDGDVVLWYWAEFGSTGGPPTLDMQPCPATATSSRPSTTPGGAPRPRARRCGSTGAASARTRAAAAASGGTPGSSAPRSPARCGRTP